jgi:hypothetical protein
VQLSLRHLYKLRLRFLAAMMVTLEIKVGRARAAFSHDFQATSPRPFELAKRAMPQNRNACPGNVANELDALIPDSSVRVCNLKGHFGRACARLIGYLRHLSLWRPRRVPTARLRVGSIALT